jgi:polyphenol oxidase
VSELRARLPGGRVVFTARHEGNMSSVGGVDAERGALNRELLRDRLGLRVLVRGYQVHGTHVHHANGRDESDELPRADGIVVSERLTGASVLTADCVPVALGAEGAVAMLHAGWRGLAAGVLENGVVAVRELVGTAPIVAVVGPCAGACCYEVGPEVHAAHGASGRPRGPIDLRGIAHARLHAIGVAAIADVGGCTICDERWFSHRREGEAAGRMIAVAWRD